MRILMVNKFLYPNGGSETYIFKLGEYLIRQGHEVEYFGMEHEKRIVGNRAGAYTTNMDFHAGKLKNLINPFRIIYSPEARRKIGKALRQFQPEVVHLNNINFQLTPSIIYEIKKYEKKSKHRVRIVYTAHDYQLICPNHMLNNPNTGRNCEKCIGGRFINCAKGRCIHGSLVRSTFGMLEAYFYRFLKTYRHIDTIICPSMFMEKKLNTNPLFASKTVVLHNFVEPVEPRPVRKENYILYFGRFSEEKGINTLLKVCKSMPEIRFVFAGTGPLEDKLAGNPNIENVGFQSGAKLEMLIRKAKFSICPSQWYENCPFSVMESQMYGTPVLGAEIGGIPELIEVGRTGELFQSADADDLRNKIIQLWNDPDRISYYTKNCRKVKFNSISDYYKKLSKIYCPEEAIGNPKRKQEENRKSWGSEYVCY